MGRVVVLAMVVLSALVIVGFVDSSPRIVANEVPGSKILLQSAGHHSGDSQAQNLAGQGVVRLQRGMTLLGLLKEGPAVRLAHVDTCGHGVADDGKSVSRFKDVILEAGDAFSDYAVVAHDSAVCGDAKKLQFTLDDFGLKLGESLKLRQPYIAVLSSGQDPQEYVGEPATLLSVMLDLSEASESSVSQRKLSSLPKVAHAGGGYEGRTYTNSLDAMNDNKKHFSLIEIDFSWTSDRELVCLHDWDYHFESNFGLVNDEPLSLDGFESIVDERSSLEQCSLSSLADWLRNNPSVRIVTDIKEENIEGLSLILESFPDLKHRFVPQVYTPGEYFAAKRLGFDDIIWTLYRYSGSDDEILSALFVMDLYGLTMTKAHAERGLAQKAKEQRGVLSWVHTINKVDEFEGLKNQGVSSIYTDWLSG